MPAAFQGTPFRSGNVPIVDLNPPKWVDRRLQRAEVDFIQKMNQERQERHAGNSDLDARIASYELAYPDANTRA